MAAGHAYTTRYDEITQGFERMERCLDDAILWDDNLEENINATELIDKKETTTNLAINAIDARRRLEKLRGTSTGRSASSLLTAGIVWEHSRVLTRRST